MNDIENYESIYYLDHPHFAVGHVDQWGESGYLLCDGYVYSYEEDRKCQYGRTYSKRSIDDFLGYAANANLSIPAYFMEQLNKY